MQMKHNTELAAAPPAKRVKLNNDVIPSNFSTNELGVTNNWKMFGTKNSPTLYVRDFDTSKSDKDKKVAGFDMDWNLIQTKSGKRHPRSPDDWKLWHDSVPTKLQALHREGYTICVFTNQRGISNGKTKAIDIFKKIEDIQSSLEVPLIAFISAANDCFRKPRVNAWRQMEKIVGNVLRKDSFFVGDAAGRVPPSVKKKDFSNTDLKFAMNLGISFMTPEECFLGLTQTYEKNNFSFDPRKLGENPTKLPCFSKASFEMIIMVGSPGSGKSFFSRNIFSSYERINQDTLKTKKKCLKACQIALDSKKCVIIDKQNTSVNDRAPYIEMANKAGASVKCIWMNVSKEFCFHLNTYRSLNVASFEHRGVKEVPPVVIHSFYKKLEKPTLKEGFTDIIPIGLNHFTLSDKSADVALIRSFLL